MKYLLALLLLAGCRATDAMPDEFNVQFGDASGASSSASSTGPWGHGRSSASSDGDTQWVAVGWTWKIGDVADREDRAATEARYLKAIEAIRVPMPDPKPEPVVEAHNPKEPNAAWWEYLLYFGTTVGVVIKVVMSATKEPKHAA